jgi:TolB protein
MHPNEERGMKRTVTITGISLVLLSCAGETGRSGPEPSLVVDDSSGVIVGGGMPSPDGTRLAFARSVSGKSAIFVAAPDGSNPVQLTHGVWDYEPWWSPDGKWIAYYAESPDFDLFVVSADGGEPRPLSSGPSRDSPRGWLRDGSGIVAVRARQGDDHVIVVPLDGGAARRLGPEMPGHQHGSVSPDGTKFGFDIHQGGGDATVWVQEMAGGEPRQLTTENLENTSAPLMWSPDSRSLAYTSRRTGTTDIWVVDVASGEKRQLTSDVRNDFSARWSPDGRWIAFLSDRGGQTDVWVVSAAGGDAVRVTNDRALEVNPRWSPDGRSLYYGRFQTGTELMLLPTDSGAGRTLLSWPGHVIESPVVSPDGRTILFDSDRSGNSDIWSFSLSGGEPAPFAVSPLNDRAPVYSPDGSQVVFLSDRAGSPDLWIVPAAGGAPRQLTEGPANDGVADWSPDGKSIVFVSNRGGPGGDLWVVPAAGGEPTRLTQGNVRPTGVEWAADGTYIYFTGERSGGGQELYRIAASGGRPQALGAKPGIGNAKLSPDGSQLAYSSFEGGWAFLDVIAAAGGVPRRLTTQTEGVFHPWAVWSPDGSFLVVHALDLEANRDAIDLWTVRIADGSWRRLTRTLMASEGVAGFTADGQMVVAATTARTQVMNVVVTELLGRAPETP